MQMARYPGRSDTCFNDQRLIKRETPYQMFTSKINKTIILTFTFVPPDSVISHMEDITDRKMAEQKLLLSKKKITGAVHSAHKCRGGVEKHISRELHDSIGQYLTAVKISMENTRQELLEKRDILKAATLLESGLNLLKQTSDEVHRIPMDLRYPFWMIWAFWRPSLDLPGISGDLHEHEGRAGFSD